MGAEERIQDISPESFHVAVIGGGIGGLTAALALSTYSPKLKNITVYEQSPEIGEIGAGVSIGVQAGRVLDKLGVWDALSLISGDRGTIHRSTRRWDNGEVIVDVAAAASKSGEKVKQLSLHRGEFLDILYAEIRRRGCADVKTDKRAVALEDLGTMVSIRFADNTTATAHLVIGCDGIRSTIRSQFIVDNPTYSGRVAYRGILPFSGTELESTWPFPYWTVSWLGPDKHILVYPISKNRLLNVVAFVCKSESEIGGLKESWKSTAPREQLAEEYKGWAPQVEKIILQMDPIVSKWKINDRELLSQWSYMDGKVVLSGDAAHAMLPHQGSGAGHAIEDADVIGLAVRDYLANPTNGLSTYTSLYQEARLPRAHRAQITSREAGNIYDVQDPDFKGLSFEECLPMIKDKLKDRMAWIWSGDSSKDYMTAKAKAGIS